MLNPNAIEFKPRPATTTTTTTTEQQQQQQQPKADSSHSSRRSSKATTHGKRPTQVTNAGHAGSSNAKQKKKKQPQEHGKQQQQPSRRKGRAESLPVSKDTPQQHAFFDQPAKFITLEETIDPICQLSIKDRSEKKIVHGYERYIEWVMQVYLLLVVAKETPFLIM